MMVQLTDTLWNTTYTTNHPEEEVHQHVSFDVVVGIFFVFICIMYALHFYLKRKQRQNFDMNYFELEAL